MGIQRVSWSLLCEWWCVPVDADEAEVLQAILKEFEAPGVGADLVRDRLYGGFTCADCDDTRHVAFKTGNYTYTGDGNYPAGQDQRNEDWATLIKMSAENGPFIGGGLFCEDAPKQEVAT